MTMEELLARDGKLIYKTRGISMEPMLRQNRDLVILETPKARLKPLDVALYKRGKDLVLHRVLKVEEDHYMIRGDNTYAWERVPDDAVLAVLTGFQRKGKQYSVSDGRYLFYAKFWHSIYPLRWFVVNVIRRMKRCARRLLGRK
ncbi:MAG: S24/S26 family peptidase [Lachnospiraceae bacterium]|jgi:signal peptidase I|nr:S24/S26 family peptidase [Lachnospiraceae bacterium]